ncbi:helix-turn-helix transcriptional regulator [Streptomyces sp. Z26]|uniref:helix-turn-helix domain-containing protein n=1 Tax=Streptomyces sp. Z26 TaxID=2500177 RepID=UPI000EF1701D|nr:helix-turn-helix transcriptional regulator [Streptomyces sp. Z26]RLL66006.1 XRE family transcriptional regulator [Streptomyces sp. Z26]
MTAEHVAGHVDAEPDDAGGGDVTAEDHRAGDHAADDDTGTGDARGEPERSDSLKTFGAVVQAFRRRAGLTQEEWGPRSGYAVSTCAAIEQGRRFPPRQFVERAEAEFDAFGTLREAAKHLSRQPGLASWFRQWAKLETRARSLYTYECRVVPGLLQTEAYARAVMRAVPPMPTDEQLDQRVAARMDRQELLHRKEPVNLSFIIEQAVLERRTGGDEVTAGLLDQLIECAGLYNVELQIMSLVQPEHAGTDGPLRLVETPEHQWFGYSEGQESGQLISDEKALSWLHMRYAKLRSQALTPVDSLSLLKRMRGAL